MIRGQEITAAEEQTARLIAGECHGRMIDQPWFGVLYVIASGAVLAGGLIGAPFGLTGAELGLIFGAVFALIVGLFFLWRRARIRDWTRMHPHINLPEPA